MVSAVGFHFKHDWKPLEHLNYLLKSSLLVLWNMDYNEVLVVWTRLQSWSWIEIDSEVEPQNVGW